jgi:hypothetical protein
MLNPLIGEAGRQYTRARILAFNAILERVTQEYDVGDSNHHYVYTPAAFEYRFDERHVSDIDCFHPSAFGQKTLSDKTWNPALFAGCK